MNQYSQEELQQMRALERAKEEKLTMLLSQGNPDALLLMKNMSYQVSQDSFDEMVRENMEEFGMSREEAIEDALEQCKKQGLGSNNIDTH